MRLNKSHLLQLIIGIEPEDLGAPRFKRFWSSRTGFVDRPCDATAFLEESAAVHRARRLRQLGVKAFVVREASAPWLFTPLREKTHPEDAP